MSKFAFPFVYGAIGLLGTTTVLAQEAAGAADPPEEGAEPSSAEITQLDGVVVTAQKRVERLLDVPMSITAVSAEQLVEAGVGSTRELQQIVPGLTAVNNGHGFVPVIRGISSQGTSPGDETNVSIYLDDVYLGMPSAGLLDLVDIERIEVLKGPQGTLFGRNATGGAIRIVTRSPSQTPQALFNVDYGFDYEEWNLGAYVTGPLSEQIAGSLSVSYREGDGYIDGIGQNAGRTYGGPDNHVVRGKLLFEPTEAIDIILAADTMKASNDAVVAVSTPPGVNPFPGSIPNQPYQYAAGTQPENRIESSGASLDVQWDPSDALSVRSITAYREFELPHYQSDNDRTDLPVITLALSQYQDNFSQELNFSGNPGDRLSWLAGLYYYESKAGVPYFSVVPGDLPGGPVSSSFTSRVRTSSYAGFGDLTWNASERLHFTLGARFTSETKKYRYQNLIPAVGTPVEDESTWDSPTYRGVVRYDFAKDANVYLSVSNGFKSGVYDAYSGLGIPVDPEKVNAIEIGSKVRVNGVTLTAAAYDYDYDDIQVSSFATLQGVVVQSLTNAAEAKMRGFEFTAEGALTDRLSIMTGVNWTPKAEFVEFAEASVTVPIPGAPGPIIAEVIAPYDVSGSRIPRTPKWTANARLTYIAPMFGGDFSGTISGFFSPGFYWQAGNLTEEPSYEVIGMRLSWTDATGRFTYSLWGNNLTDSDHSIFTAPNVRGNSIAWAQGRQLGIGFAARF